jgi:hypothetical protein
VTLRAGNESKRFPQFGFVQYLPTLKGRGSLEDTPQAVDVMTNYGMEISRRVQPPGEGRQLCAGAQAFITMEKPRKQHPQHDALLWEWEVILGAEMLSYVEWHRRKAAKLWQFATRLHISAH